nr:RHS repeat-associated core domain-containing protein [Methylosinus sp. Sm6]
MPDHLGAPHEIVNAANARVWLWDHDPFGNGAPVAAAGFSHDLRFPGQIYDSETRLHNNGFRDYSPALGRYVETDPIGLEGGINTYAYANNNPLNAVDPTGTLVTPETYVWDIPNVVMGLVSLFDNLFHGNFASAGIDAAGLGVDVAAVVLPGVPAGAGATIAAGRKAAHYSVAFETTIAKAGVGTRGSHFTDANTSLAATMKKDPEFAKMMDSLGVSIPQRLDQSPAGWSWHHVPDQPGMLQLVPRDQHQGSAWQHLLHPARRLGRQTVYLCCKAVVRDYAGCRGTAGR